MKEGSEKGYEEGRRVYVGRKEILEMERGSEERKKSGRR